jgi:hypothetical protein
MSSYNNSVDALRRLLSTGQSSPAGSCRITKIPQYVLHMTNGIEYCAVEITCDDATQYGIQSYGEEAIELRKEVLGHYALEKEGNKEMPLAYNIS